MTFWTEEADMPWIELPNGYFFRLEAIDPTSGSAVASVSVSNVAVYGAAATASDVTETDLPAWVPDGDQEEA